MTTRQVPPAGDATNYQLTRCREDSIVLSPMFTTPVENQCSTGASTCPEKDKRKNNKKLKKKTFWSQKAELPSGWGVGEVSKQGGG